MRWKFDAVVVSDLHLGARNARAREFLAFLNAIDTDRLIVAGDLFDCPRLGGLCDAPIAVLDALREMKKRNKLDWVLGNHDPPAAWCDALLGLPATDEAHLDIGTRRYVVCHGHAWDESLSLPSMVVHLADQFYRGCQWLDPTHRLARQLKYRSKQFLSVIGRLQTGAVRHARDRGFDGVILGHTHSVIDTRDSDVHYLNAGCWTERPASFIGVRKGRALPYLWDNRIYPYEKLSTPDRVCRVPLPVEDMLRALDPAGCGTRELA